MIKHFFNSIYSKVSEEISTTTFHGGYKEIYILLDELEGQMSRKHFYLLVNFTDEVMGIGQSEIPDARYSSIVQKNYPSNLGF